MPPPKRESLDDYFARLPDVAKPHLTKLRELSLAADKTVVEALHWNAPAYVSKDGVRLWMLQSFKAHCSLRFPVHEFAAHRADVEAAGFEAGAGFIKIPYEAKLPVALCKKLIKARLDEYKATGSKWS